MVDHRHGQRHPVPADAWEGVQGGNAEQSTARTRSQTEHAEAEKLREGMQGKKLKEGGPGRAT